MPKNKAEKKDVKKLSFLEWLDTNILLLLSGFLLAFIPLFPKLPLFDAIPGYIVRVRIEDIFVGITAIIWFIQLLRKKIVWKTHLSYFIFAYAIVGVLSTLSAVFITKTVPFEPLHVGKTVLHYFRYLEYFSLFFIVYSSVKTRRDLLFLLKTLAATVIGVGIYGLGQKYLYWPVYSTMNREFSKGIRLYLTEHARVQSTFGGHYDLAAYLVILTPLLMSFMFTAKKRLHTFLLWIAFLLATWMLVVSASRSSFISFLIGASIVIFLLTLKKDTIKSKLSFFFSKSIVFGLVVFMTTVWFGADLYERLLQTMEAYPTVHNAYHGFNRERKEFIASVIPKDLFSGFKVEKPENAISTEDAAVMVNSDQQPTSEKPSDVFVDVPVTVSVATISADGSVEIIEVEQERTYSETAIKHGLSSAIRLETLWPRAIAGFWKNPLLGSGYATLTKESTIQFTEAESTDNNYLRTLGETGLLGFITFYGAVLLSLFVAAKIYINNSDLLSQSLGAGFIAATIGLLTNATYIDVFAASKVAFTFWGIVGILFAYRFLLDTEKTQKKSKTI